MRRGDTSCECGNTDDLEWVVGELLCREWRTCPHGQTYNGHPHAPTHSSNYCSECVRDLFTVETFYGPLLTDPEAYYTYLDQWGLPFWGTSSRSVSEDDEMYAIALNWPT